MSWRTSVNLNPGATSRSLPYFLYRGVTWLKVLKAVVSQLTFVVALMVKLITGHAGNTKLGNDVNREYFEKHRQECLRLQGTRLTAGGIFHISNIKDYPMLRADSLFWLVNNREIWSRISRLTSSAWDIKDKGTSLMTSQWRFRPPSTFITATVRPSNTVFIRWFRPDQFDNWDFKAAETFQNVTNIFWAWDKFVNPCLLPRIREFIHT